MSDVSIMAQDGAMLTMGDW